MSLSFSLKWPDLFVLLYLHAVKLKDKPKSVKSLTVTDGGKGKRFFTSELKFSSDLRWKWRICFLWTVRSLVAVEEVFWTDSHKVLVCEPCGKSQHLVFIWHRKTEKPHMPSLPVLYNLSRVWRSFERHPSGEVQQYSCAKVLPLTLGAGHHQWPCLGWHSHHPHARADTSTRPARVQKLQQVIPK